MTGTTCHQREDSRLGSRDGGWGGSEVKEEGAWGEEGGERSGEGAWGDG